MCFSSLMTVISHVHLYFRCPSEIFLVYIHAMLPFDACTYDACQIFA